VQKGSKSKLLEFEVSGSSCCSITVAVRVGIKTAVFDAAPFPVSIAAVHCATSGLQQ